MVSDIFAMMQICCISWSAIRQFEIEERTYQYSGLTQSTNVNATIDTSRPTMTGRVGEQNGGRRQQVLQHEIRRRRSTIVVIDNDNERRSWLQVHLDLLARCCRKLTTSGTSILSLNFIFCRLNRGNSPKYDETTHKTLFSTVGYDNSKLATRRNRYVDRT